MQVTHLEEESCAFFHVIDSNQNRQGTLFSLLPSVAPHGQSIIRNLLPFLKWMLTPIAETDQIIKMVKQFHPKTITNQNHLLWDADNNCIQQAANNMIAKALQDYPVYNLTSLATRPPTVVTTAMPMQNPPSKVGGQTQFQQSNPTNNDSLSNSNLSQGMWFTTTMMQLDTLATRQEKLEKQMQEWFKMILSELTKIHRDMQIIMTLTIWGIQRYQLTVLT